MESRGSRVKSIEDYYRNKNFFKHTSAGIFGVSLPRDIVQICNLLNISQKDTFVDLGSGDGRTVLTAALFCSATGIELDDSLHKDSITARDTIGINTVFLNQDFLTIDFSKYSWIFIFPDREFTHQLEVKIKNEMKGKLIVYSNLYLPKTLKMKKEINLDGMVAFVYSSC